MNLIDHFLESQKEKQPNTLISYRLDLIAWENYLSDRHISITNATINNIVEYRHWMTTDKEKPVKPSTVNRSIVVLKQFYDWANRNGHVTSNIASNFKIKRSTVNNTEVKWLTPQESEVLQYSLESLNNPSGIRDRTVIYLMLFAGLRVSEVSNLRIVDIFGSNKKNQSIYVKAGKGDKDRTVPINDKLYGAIKEWITVRSRYKTADSSEYLFVSERASQLTRQGIDALVRYRFKMTNIHGHSSHSLRHTFAKSLANQNIRLQEIAKLCGHSDIRTTMIYVEPSAEELRKAVNML